MVAKKSIQSVSKKLLIAHEAIYQQVDTEISSQAEAVSLNERFAKSKKKHFIIEPLSYSDLPVKLSHM